MISSRSEEKNRVLWVLRVCCVVQCFIYLGAMRSSSKQPRIGTFAWSRFNYIEDGIGATSTLSVLHHRKCRCHKLCLVLEKISLAPRNRTTFAHTYLHLCFEFDILYTRASLDITPTFFLTWVKCFLLIHDVICPCMKAMQRPDCLEAGAWDSWLLVQDFFQCHNLKSNFGGQYNYDMTMTIPYYCNGSGGTSEPSWTSPWRT